MDGDNHNTLIVDFISRLTSSFIRLSTDMKRDFSSDDVKNYFCDIFFDKNSDFPIKPLSNVAALLSLELLQQNNPLVFSLDISVKFKGDREKGIMSTDWENTHLFHSILVCSPS